MDDLPDLPSLPAEQRRRFVLALCERALRVWKAHFPPGRELRYIESVVGTLQVVDVDLPCDALDAVRCGEDVKGVQARYLEPLSALQDGDLELPDEVELAFYAVYNAFRRYLLGAKVEEALIVKQALAAAPEAERGLWIEDAVRASKIAVP